jgi:hypothetical protein
MLPCRAAMDAKEQLQPFSYRTGGMRDRALPLPRPAMLDMSHARRLIP